MPQGRHLLRLADEADVPDLRVPRDGQGGGAGQDQVDLGLRLLQELLEIGEEGDAALVLVDAADVKEEGPLEAVLEAEVEGGIGMGQVQSAPDDDARHLPVPARVLDQGLLLGREVDDATRRAEERLEDVGQIVFVDAEASIANSNLHVRTLRRQLEGVDVAAEPLRQPDVALHERLVAIEGMSIDGALLAERTARRDLEASGRAPPVGRRRSG